MEKYEKVIIIKRILFLILGVTLISISYIYPELDPPPFFMVLSGSIIIGCNLPGLSFKNMKLDKETKAKIDKFFDEITSEELLEKAEELGYGLVLVPVKKDDEEEEEKVKLNEFHFHEFLDRTHLAAEYLEQSLIEHPVAEQFPEWREKVIEAQTILFELYQEVGTYTDKEEENE